MIGFRCRRALVVAATLPVLAAGVVWAPSAAAAPPLPRPFEAVDGFAGGLADETQTLDEICTSLEDLPPDLGDPDFRAALDEFESLNRITVVFGSSDIDVILPVPLSGDRLIVADGGIDVIVAGTGNDYICSGGDIDVVATVSGDDEVDSGEAGDVVLTGTGDDRVNTGESADILCWTTLGDNADCTVPVVSIPPAI